MKLSPKPQIKKNFLHQYLQSNQLRIKILKEWLLVLVIELIPLQKRKECIGEWIFRLKEELQYLHLVMVLSNVLIIDLLVLEGILELIMVLDIQVFMLIYKNIMLEGARK